MNRQQTSSSRTIPSVQGHGLNSHSAQQHISTSDIPNLGVDVRFDSLKKYLDEISGALNQHAVKINEFEKDMTTKVEINVLSETINMITEGWGIFDTELAKISKQLMGKDLIDTIGNGRLENTLSMLDNSANKLINREIQQSHSVTHIYQKLKLVDPRLKELDERTKIKVDTQLWKEKKKKHKRHFQKEIEDLKIYMESRIKEIGKRVSEQVQVVAEKGEEIEKKTSWKINDLDAQLKHKINSQYVEDSSRAIEERIRREFSQYFIDSDKTTLMYNELKTQIKYVDDQIMEKVRSNKKSINDLEELIDKKYLPRIIFDEKTKVINDKLYELLQRMKEVDKRSDLGPLIERQGQRSKQLEEKLFALDQELQRKFAEIMLHQQQEEYKKQQEENLHKLCTLEGLMNNMQTDLTKSKVTQMDVESDLIHRMEKIEEDIKNGPFGMSKKAKTGEKQTFNIEDLATKRDIEVQIETTAQEIKLKLQETIDGVYRDMKKFNEDERTVRLFTQLNEVQRRHEQLESRVAKTSREFDMHSLIKQLREKAENDTVRRDFAVQDTRILQVSDSVGQIRTDVDNMAKLYSRLVAGIRDGTLSTQEEQLVIMSKRLLPVNCISCNLLPHKMSDKHRRQASALKTAQKNDGYILGTDKRPYKVDINHMAIQQSQYIEQVQQTKMNHPQSPQAEQFQSQTKMMPQQNQSQQQLNLLSSIASDQDMMSLGGGTGFLYLDKSQNSAVGPSVLKKGGRPSTAKLYKTDGLQKKNRPESAKES